MTRYLILVSLFATLFFAGCSGQAGEYAAASSISKNGFARDAAALTELNGEEIKIWGFVDHSNMYGDEGAREILGDWWGGNGPDVSTWRFNLKTQADDAAGKSFPVTVPNDAGRDEILRRFAADAQAQQPTKVLLTGKLVTFDAPTNASTLTALTLELQSSGDILFENRNERR